MASRKSLPGFLRRSRRLEVEGEDSSTEGGGDADNTNNSSTRNDDEQEEVIRKAVPDTEPTAVSSSNKNGHVSHSEKTTTPTEPAPVVVLLEDEEDLSEYFDQLHTSEQRQHSLSDSWLHIPAVLPPAALPDLHRKSYRETALDKILAAPVVNLAELRKVSWNGIPPIHRATAWKLLLGYLPTNRARREQTLAKRQNEYLDAVRQHYDIHDDSRTLQEQETLRQVLVDVPRTAPHVALFRNDRIRRILTRLLYIWAMRHPASSYVQGINDLATPLLAVFLADYFQGQDVLDGHVMNHLSDEHLNQLEADVYGCLTNLLAGIQDHYTADQPGMQRMVMRLEELVQRIDKELCQHFKDCGILFLQFSFKWMNCLLLREFSLKCVFRLWDTYISEKDGFEGFHVYVCAAFLCQFSSQLQQMSFDELFAFMQDIPTQDWTDTEIEVLLSQAFVLTSLFGGSDAHLTSANN
jgi:hypothetical protein